MMGIEGGGRVAGGTAGPELGNPAGQLAATALSRILKGLLGHLLLDCWGYRIIGAIA